MAEATELGELSITQLATLTGCIPRTVRKRLDQAGVQPIREDGRTLFYAPRVALPAILCGDEGMNPAAEKARLDRARAELAELEIERRRCNLLPTADADRVWSRRARRWMKQVHTLPSRAAARIEGFSPAMARKLRGLIDETAVELGASK